LSAFFSNVSTVLQHVNALASELQILIIFTDKKIFLTSKQIGPLRLVNFICYVLKPVHSVFEILTKSTKVPNIFSQNIDKCHKNVDSMFQNQYGYRRVMRYTCIKRTCARHENHALNFAFSQKRIWLSILDTNIWIRLFANEWQQTNITYS